MSERAISDPTEHGWTEVDGKWMWAGSGGGSGSIQDGDTEGQITTWDGTEWTPEAAVVVDGGNVGIGTDTPLYTSEGRTGLTVNGDTSANLVFSHSEAPAHYLLSDASGLTVGDDSGANLIIDADGAVVFKKSDGTTIVTFDKDGDAYFAGGLGKFSGDVQVDGRLFVNGEEVTAGGGLWTDNGDGSISYSGTVRATDMVATG